MNKDNGQVFFSTKRGQTFYLHAWEISIIGGKRPNSRDFNDPGHDLHDPDAALPVDAMLVQSIKMRGQKQAISVRKEKAPADLDLRQPENMRPEDVAVVVFGRQRLKAITFINDEGGLWGTPDEVLVECRHVAKGTSLQDAAEDSMIENSQRREVRAFAVIEKAKAYLAKHGDDDEVLARCAVANRLTVKRLKQLLEFAEAAPAPTVKALKDGRIGVTAALELAKLPAAKQAEVLAAPARVSGSRAKRAAALAAGKRVRPSIKEIRAEQRALLSRESVGAQRLADEAAARALSWVLGEADRPCEVPNAPASGMGASRAMRRRAGR